MIGRFAMRGRIRQFRASSAVASRTIVSNSASAHLGRNIIASIVLQSGALDGIINDVMISSRVMTTSS